MVIQSCMFSRESNAVSLFARSPHDRTAVPKCVTTPLHKGYCCIWLKYTVIWFNFPPWYRQVLTSDSIRHS